jgi:tRNA pseudouridine55 synthase
MATGVLPILLGRATRLMEHVSGASKHYLATLELGATTDTLDAEGKVVQRRAVDPGLGADQVSSALERFTGSVRQKVPVYSAVRRDGKRLYEMARAGLEVDQPERVVRIDEIELVEVRLPHVVISVTCGKGTYIRQLASDIGEALRCGAHLTGLRRLRVGRFDLAGALEGARLEQATRRHLVARLRPLLDVVSHLDRLEVDARQATALAYGQSIAIDSKETLEPVAAKLLDGDLVALGKTSEGRFHPQRVFVSAEDLSPTPWA